MIHIQKTFYLGFKPFKVNLIKRSPFNLFFKVHKNFSTSDNKNQNNNNLNNKNTQSNPSQVSNSEVKSDQTSNEAQNQKQQIKFTPEEQGLINSYKPDEFLNVFMNLDPNHNFQKDLIVAKKKYERSTKQLRANILFEDLLKTQVLIPVYDTKGKPYTHMWLKNLFNIFFFGLTIWFFQSLANIDPKNKIYLERTTAGSFMKIFFYGFAYWFLFVGFYRYLKFQRRFVQKIVYDTKSENFILTKRRFFGGYSTKEVSRFKLVYTENQFLNKKGTNYFNLDTKEQYSIPYKDSWMKQDLFSHLIAQRIRV